MPTLITAYAGPTGATVHITDARDTSELSIAGHGSALVQKCGDTLRIQVVAGSAWFEVSTRVGEPSAVPNLSEAERERLALLVEENGEVLQAIGKVLRHGFESRNPLDRSSETNRLQLAREVGHLEHAVNRLTGAGDLERDTIDDARERKERTVGRWLHHQG